MSYVSLSQFYDSYHKDATEEFHLNYFNSLHQTTKGGRVQ